MHIKKRWMLGALLSAGLTLGLRAGNADEFTVPVEYFTLPNGLRVVL